MRALAPLLLLVSACAAAPDPSDLAMASQSIVGGQRDPGDPAVVMLRWGGSFCSGTLITPRLVLTAGHCVDNLGTPPSEVYFGQDPFGPGRSQGVAVRAVQAIRHPAYNDSDLGDTIQNDVSIIVLETPVTSVTPIRPSFGLLPVSQIVGKPVTYVGFGQQGEFGDYGVKETVTVIGQRVTGWNIEAGTAICFGDSGGPALQTLAGKQVIVGVSSWVASQACLFASVSQRVDIHQTWILGIEAQYDPPTCASDARCVPGCATPDPDCLCQADGICTAGCPVPDPDCPPPPPRAPGERCGSHDECGANGACVQLEAGAPAVCAARCGDGLASCGDGDQCQALANASPPLSVCTTAPAGCSVAATGRSRGSAAFLLGLTVLAFVLRKGAYTRSTHGRRRHR